MINILQIGMTANWGGVETYLIQQFHHINSEKLHYDFVNNEAENEIVFADQIKSKGSIIHYICSRHVNPLKHYISWLLLMFKYRNYYSAVVYNSNTMEYVFPLVAAKLFGIPIRIVHSHNAGYRHELSILRKILVKMNTILLHWSATHYWGCSVKAAQWMFGTIEGVNIVHNAIDINKYKYNAEKRGIVRKKLNLSNCFVVGHVGRFSYQKNHEFLIKMFALLKKRKPNSKLLLIGDTSKSSSYLIDAQEQVKKLQLEQDVIFLGLRSDVNELMQAMDIFVLPSRFEGLPFVGIEAQAAGLPCYLSTEITEELAISDLCTYIDFDEAKWVDRICSDNSIKRKRFSPVNDIADNGYDICEEIKKINQFYNV